MSQALLSEPVCMPPCRDGTSNRIKWQGVKWLAASGALLSDNKVAPQLLGEMVIAAAAARSGTLGRRPPNAMLALMSDIQVIWQLCNAKPLSDSSNTQSLCLTGHWRQRIVTLGLPVMMRDDISSRAIQLAWPPSRVLGSPMPELLAFQR